MSLPSEILFTASRIFVMSVSAKFFELLLRIQPADSEHAQAQRHAESIKLRLRNSFDVHSFLPVGSHARGTAIRGLSDLDLFVLLTRDAVRWGDSYVRSNTVLNNIRGDLSERFPNTGMARDGQAVTIGFGQGADTVDIVPAFFGKAGPDGWPRYFMPDGSGWWMATSPAYHASYLKQENERSRGKLRGVAQLLKFWRDTRSPRVPIFSFHVELLLAANRSCVGVKSYGECVHDALALLVRRKCAGLNDPLSVSGIVPCVKSESQRAGALRSLEYALEHARLALEADSWGTLPEAYRQWNIVFNGAFPA